MLSAAAMRASSSARRASIASASAAASAAWASSSGALKTASTSPRRTWLPRSTAIDSMKPDTRATTSTA
jgi:hypothetical protein